MSFLMIEDSQSDAVLAEFYISQVVKGLRVEHRTGAPDSLSVVDAHAGVIIDQNLRGELGVTVARDIHAWDWRKPIMILTGAPMTDIDLISAYEYAWIVASKNDLARSLSKFRAFARMCAACEIATGKTTR